MGTIHQSGASLTAAASCLHTPWLSNFPRLYTRWRLMAVHAGGIDASLRTACMCCQFPCNDQGTATKHHPQHHVDPFTTRTAIKKSVAHTTKTGSPFQKLQVYASKRTVVIQTNYCMRAGISSVTNRQIKRRTQRRASTMIYTVSIQCPLHQKPPKQPSKSRAATVKSLGRCIRPSALSRRGSLGWDRA